ncbi:C4-dicarboxylate ABC transporter [Methylobacterium sp. Leaf465]|jgi:TRAP-type C4-dicarboxylate transport system substrate-binding protein|uniref:TRAP transporter substrate-binding protein DctP n=1 Tax=unclassified Methylobacterium TaxID=2615210 RepID=UPI0006FB9C16|nr:MULTISPECIES: TRAP transporter substrate-binding protein DctP [unclassified Methylobacterium]KQO69266.1 C4-dicarboxylate ABC transporter [Methylobacterium sp. Leaf89]KQP52421.1 C4-dicarboxylate ABC transporter [Methylobacterium sp. Leaf111]KQT71426.1 C4-dicarboxylate ABC transporter [Methylobacterium sp. Leaf465]KQU34116.1 C4-dicarboxylate ABC transporter [Methylobacterium sp. Leaf94]
MMLTRRALVAGGLAAPAILSLGSRAQAATTLKLSHQFPGGTIDEGDFRDRMCRKFAMALAERSKGALEVQVYPGSSLMKTNAQFAAMRKGALDLSLYPSPYAGGEVPELNIGLMPALVSSYEQAIAWKKAPVGRKLTEILDAKGIILVSWVWQAGGVASRERPLYAPADAKGLKVRGGSREMDLMMKQAGAATLSIPSSESYAAMQTGACDAVITSSTSLISFRLEELGKALTSGRERSYWFMLEPLMMSKLAFERLPKDQQDLIMTIGAELEPFGQAGAKADDTKVEEIFAKAGAKVQNLDEKTLGQWRDIARDTAWKDFAGKSAGCAELLKLAEQVS